MTTDVPETGSRWTAITFAIGTSVAAVAVALLESPRIEALSDEGLGAAAWLTDMRLDSTPFAVLFCLLPVFLLVRKPLFRLPRWVAAVWRSWFANRPTEEESKPEAQAKERALHPSLALRASINKQALVLAAVVAGASLAASLHVAFQPVKVGSETYRLYELPPSYQDEFSYLFQARTFLDGRWAYPGHPTQPRLFDSMHVSNAGRVASRYFPGTGAWMSPFVAIGRPYWGHWLAGMLTAVFVFAAGRELGGNGVGFLAGMLMAVSPGMALFSNLLLAHHPGLVGLSLFLWMFLRLLRTGQWWNAALAGTGLSFAMLCRPMTAFGFGLPFGVIFLVYVLHPRSRFRTSQGFSKIPGMCVVTMGLPILLGFLVIAIQNHAVTGDWRTTPYGQFTNTYTPRHVFGFNNAERAEAKVAAGEARTNDVFLRYDLWATNLTPEAAAKNVGQRLLASSRWTLGIVPLLMSGLVFVLHRHRDEPRWWLVAAAIVSLHAVHVPYWFVGMLDYHYVFETGPLWLLVFARSTQLIVAEFVRIPPLTDALRNSHESRYRWNRPWMPAWWGLIAGTALLSAYFPLPPFWSAPRVDERIGEFTFSKRLYFVANQFLEKRIPPESRPALVLIEPDESQFHFEYVTNPPDLDAAPVIRARFRPGRTSINDVLSAFPERSVYHWRMKSGEFRPRRRLTK